MTYQPIALVVLALGGYFAGGVISNLLRGESVARMFGGSGSERAMQLLSAAAALWLGIEVIG